MRAGLVGPFILRLAVEWLASRLKYTDSIQSVGSLVLNRERQTLGGLGGGGYNSCGFHHFVFFSGFLSYNFKVMEYNCYT